MDKLALIAGLIIIGFILLGIIKKVIKTILGLVLIIALVFGGIYLYNTYPSDIKDVAGSIKQVVDKSTVKDYLRVDNNGKYYVYKKATDNNGRIIYPTGRVFDYPGVDISIDKIAKIASGNLTGLKRQYYRIDKEGNPIVPKGVTPPRKFLQPIL